MKLPSGPGVCPAFWLAAVNGIDKHRTTKAAEVDIGRVRGAFNIAHQVVHVWKPKGGNRTLLEIPAKYRE
jgi:hypothetical protein